MRATTFICFFLEKKYFMAVWYEQEFQYFVQRCRFPKFCGTTNCVVLFSNNSTMEENLKKSNQKKSSNCFASDFVVSF